MFVSLRYGQLDLVRLREAILHYLHEDPASEYRIIIGTDSSEKDGEWDFITAIVIHRVGKGGIYFWRRIVMAVGGKNKTKLVATNGKKRGFIRERIYREAALSLETADVFMHLFKRDGISKYDVEIHVDVGNFGETREMIHEVVGMIRGSGYICKTKPDSYGASKIADRHT